MQRFRREAARGRAAEQPARHSDPRLRRNRRPAVCRHAADRGPRSASGAGRRAAGAGAGGAHHRAGRQGAARRAQVGLVHRDVKPSNILLDEDDFAYLIDFGIARAADETRLTSTGDMIGTLHYMAPERLGSGEEDARADIYALACVLYECLTGSPRFPRTAIERLIVAHLNTPPPRPRPPSRMCPRSSTRSSPPAWPKTPTSATPPPSSWPTPPTTPSPRRLSPGAQPPADSPPVAAAGRRRPGQPAPRVRDAHADRRPAGPGGRPPGQQARSSTSRRPHRWTGGGPRPAAAPGGHRRRCGRASSWRPPCRRGVRRRSDAPADPGGDRLNPGVAASTRRRTRPFVQPFTGLSRPRRGGGGRGGHRLRHRQQQRSGAEAGGGLEHPEVLPFTGLVAPPAWRWTARAPSTSPTGGNNRVLKLAAGRSSRGAAVHRPHWPLRCGGGRRGQRLRHRQRQQPGGEIAGRARPPRPCCRSPASTPPTGWRWTPRATSTSPTHATTGC